MAKKDQESTAPVLYNVVRKVDGATVITGVDEDMARSERMRLDAQSAVINPETGFPTGMHMGEVATHEVQSQEGVIV